MKFPDQPFTAVYIIYSADVITDNERFIDEMSPLLHMPAGYTGMAAEERTHIAAKFTQTEGNEQYDFGYLGNESGDARYFPAGYLDKEGTEEPPEDMDPYDSRIGCGYHRKWTAELSREEWLVFADSYIIDLDASGYPESYKETLGSMTEFGNLEAVSVDNREGWNGPRLSGEVIDSGIYISFAYADEQP